MEEKKFVDLYTAEGEALEGQPWQSYPRPQMRRASFVNLNGEWEFALCREETEPGEYPQTIRVPFPPQSLLSGLKQDCPEEDYLFYRKKFAWQGRPRGKVLLHIGAADQMAAVWLNGVFLGEHTGGYAPFAFDVTQALREENTLVVRVKDEMSRCVLPYGKQTAKRGGMWYTPVSGIWQTVWLEEVPDRYIKELKIRTGENWAEITAVGGPEEGVVTVKTPEGEQQALLRGGKARVELAQPRLWSPEEPYLYEFRLEAGEDRVESYFALRTLTIEEAGGAKRLCLNGKPYFFHGVLDQGYWSDGLFTPAHPTCYEKDILAMKALGFNTLRKHIKIEPEQFYYDCDRLGMVVFQDMVNNGDYNFIRDTALPTVGFKKKKDARIHRDPAARAAFLQAMEETVHQLENHPCICYWTIFNEGWGQFESTKAYRRLKELDSSRFVASTSGWFKGGESDVETEHNYFKPFRPRKTEKPLMLTEFGGYTCRPEGHAFNPEGGYGYKHFETREEFVKALVGLYENEIIPAVKEGLCAAVYTQVSDIEDEINGLVSYDRKVSKLLPEEFLPVARRLREETAALK